MGSLQTLLRGGSFLAWLHWLEGKKEEETLELLSVPISYCPLHLTLQCFWEACETRPVGQRSAHGLASGAQARVGGARESGAWEEPEFISSEPQWELL